MVRPEVAVGVPAVVDLLVPKEVGEWHPGLVHAGLECAAQS